MMSSDRYNYWLKLTVFFAAYYLTGIIGLSLNAINGFATLIWAPSGIALAMIFMFGYRVFPVVTTAAFLVNITLGATGWTALGIAIGNTLEALVAVYLLKSVVKFSPDLERGKDVFGLVFYAAFLSTLIAATIGTTVLLASQTIHLNAYRETWVGWWVGDMLGILLIAPLIFIWTERTKLKYDRQQLFEFGLISFLLILICIFTFRGYAWLGVNENFPRYYLVFPPLIWVALRFGRRGAVTASLVVAIMALTSTLIGLEGLSETDIGRNLIYAQGFVGVTAVTTLTLAAVVAERENTVTAQKNLERRAKTLASQRKNLLALNQSKDEFVAITSHQLRTPATAVKQYIGLLLEGYSDPLTSGQKKFLRRAYDENNRQLHTIDDLLLTTRLDLGKVVLNLEKVNIAEMLGQIIGGLKGSFTARDQKVEFKPPKEKLIVVCDPKNIRAAIENLLENASNYSDTGTTIFVMLRRATGGVKIIVKDQGVGIDPRDIPKLFQKFSRVPNRLSNSVSGTGLGLYFSKKIIELHGGNIKIRSLPEKGAQFTVFLPSNKKL